jgi:3-(3-hydroxy-phenyl)propionate hydroxylase
MHKSHTYPEFAFVPSAEQRSGDPGRHPVVIVGAGPVGLTLALDLAQRGLRSVLLDDDHTVSIGSRAVCYAQRPLEIWDRLGVGETFAARGVQWKQGKVFHGKTLCYEFDLRPDAHHKMPAMINYQQYYLEEGLVRACERSGLVDLRWQQRLLALEQDNDRARLAVGTPDGTYTLDADWVVAADGANSDTRRMVGAGFTGQFFQDRFLIVDVFMRAELPAERWFWFDPPFHRGRCVLMHKECDKLWRIDFQIGRDANAEAEKRLDQVLPRVQAMLGPGVEFEVEWVSVYQYACRRIDRFRHGRVFFAGDAAHQVSPFGARGANSGVQDCDNLGWKLQAVVDGAAPPALLDSYHDERALAADDNIGHSTRATDFIAPQGRMAARLRDAVLQLARSEPFARPLVNSGRLSTPTPYLDSPLNTPDSAAFAGAMRPGTACVDAPIQRGGRDGWLLEQLGRGFVLLSFGPAAPVSAGRVSAGVLQVGTELLDPLGLLAQRYDGQPGTVYLIRPDQHVAARWRQFDAAQVQAALRRALGLQ